MHEIKCNKCNTLYKCSTYKVKGKELYYKDALTLDYFMSTCDTVFSKEFLNIVDIDLYRKAASFESIAYAYNDEFLGCKWMDSSNSTEILDRRRLSEASYKKTIIEMFTEHKIVEEIEFIKSDEIEALLEFHVEKLWKGFSKKWSSSFHTDNCKHAECSKAIIIDGHMKGTRSVCAARGVKTLESEELGTVEMSCTKMPCKGSLYCHDHKSLQMENHKASVAKEFDNEEDSTECRTLNAKGPLKKCKTAGICASVYNCGIINGMTELYGCESLTQVYMFLVWLAKELLHFPNLLAYDDACHLKKFIINPVRINKSQYSQFLATLRIVVDKMHFANHVDKWCRRNVNPYTDDQFNNINTEACEQTFQFVAKYKYTTKHMSHGKYNLFMLKLSEMFNMDRLVRNRKKSKC
ncbi:uncharacterized protein LOC143070960 [Mytilus galloprovincialis]|uniref:uncharacterized protein LOC143070960 n=1 Tax=Mytilus galloprovincialis TaxID=29158 RepID=UPI003F7C73A1